jgi:hypothetical protein
MKKITLSAMFRKWLRQLRVHSGSSRDYDVLMKRLKYVKGGRHFSRDEMNGR